MSEHDEYLIRAGEPDLAPARARLAGRQSELLAALVAGGPVPAGFDERQIRIQIHGLATKRRDTVARVDPALERILGHEYGPLFLRYAAAHPMTDGYRTDARTFATWALTADPTATWRPALERHLHPKRHWWRR
ncbi:hypothetical protein F4556_001934 [Kitasatospora gansuensis]|uniref:SCO6045-like C-terminal domain-containing protein n=1 Tax=Kitasatospora gansuensis TaxID=258050 RepID=A0A7W7S9I5_9ACTN|nr:hypothetical protein [Kitasatospora gansuensis]